LYKSKLGEEGRVKLGVTVKLSYNYLRQTLLSAEIVKITRYFFDFPNGNFIFI